MTFCKQCGRQIIMTPNGEWRRDVPFLRLNGAVYFCTVECKEVYWRKYLAFTGR